jgi:hypothetical protein
VILAEGLLVDLLQGAGHREHPEGDEDQAGDGGGVRRCQRRGDQVVHDSRCPAVQAEAERDVIINALAGERAQPDDEREQRDQQPRAEQHGLVGEIKSLQLPHEASRGVR